MLKKTALLIGLVALLGCGTNLQGTVGYDDGTPAVGVPVLITGANGVQSKATTDALGGFSVPQVATPYSAAVATVAKGPNDIFTASLYLGLTRSEPFLYLETNPPATDFRDATILVTLAGGTYPQPATSYTTNLGFVSAEAFSNVALTGTLSAVNSLDVPWFDASSSSSTTTGQLLGLQAVTDGAGLPTSYTGFGAVNASVTGGNVTNTSLQLAPVSSTTVTGTLNLPPGYNFVELDAYLLTGEGGVLQVLADTAPQASFSYALPSVPETTLQLQAFAVGDNNAFWLPSAVFAANASTVVLHCPAPPTLISPADNATGVTNATPFSWSEIPGSVYRVSFGGSLYVNTASTSLTLPDLSPIGFGPIAGEGQQLWQVTADGSTSSVDDTASPPKPNLQPGVYCNATSPNQAFTAAAGP
jgi:hypothetical protein